MKYKILVEELEEWGKVITKGLSRLFSLLGLLMEEERSLDNKGVWVTGVLLGINKSFNILLSYAIVDVQDKKGP